MKFKIDWNKSVFAGLVGTAVMTIVGIWVAPMMGLAKMNPAEMLAGAMAGNLVLGWVAHLMIGVVLAVVYAILVAGLPGVPVLKGAVYGVAPWLMAQLIVIPMMGMPMFSGDLSLAMGSLLGHLIFGAVVGGIYGQPETVASSGGARGVQH